MEDIFENMENEEDYKISEKKDDHQLNEESSNYLEYVSK